MKINRSLTEKLWQINGFSLSEIESIIPQLESSTSFDRYDSIRQGFQLLCHKKGGATRFFFLRHDASQQCIIFPPYEVPANKHKAFDHFQHLNKQLKAIEAEGVPLATHESFNISALETEALAAASPSASVSRADPVLESIEHINKLNVDQPKSHDLVQAWDYLTILSASESTPEVETAKEKCRKLITHFIKDRGVNFYFRKHENKVQCVFYQKDNDSVTPLEHSTHGAKLFDTLSNELDMLTEKSSRHHFVRIFSFSLDPIASIRHLKQNPVNLDRTQFNRLLSEAILASQQDFVSHETFLDLLMLFKNRDFSVLNRANIQGLLDCICQFFVAKSFENQENMTAETFNNCFNIIKTVIRYFDSRQITTLFCASQCFFSEDQILEILPLIEGLFEYAKLEAIFTWLENRPDTPKRDNLLNALIPLYKELSFVEKSQLAEKFGNLLKTHLNFASHLPTEIPTAISLSEAPAATFTKKTKRSKAIKAKEPPVEKSPIEEIENLLKPFKRWQNTTILSNHHKTVIEPTQNFLKAYYKIKDPVEKNSALQNFIKFTIKNKFYVKFPGPREGKLNFFEILAYYGNDNLILRLGGLLRNQNPSLLHDDSRYALFWAATNLQLSTTRILLNSFEWDPNSCNNFNEASLWYLCVLKEPGSSLLKPMINLLIDEGAHVDALTFQNYTILMGAVISDRLDSVEILLQRGANPNYTVIDPFNRPINALDLAMALSNDNIEKQLRARGASYASGPTPSQLKKVSFEVEKPDRVDAAYISSELAQLSVDKSLYRSELNKLSSHYLSHIENADILKIIAFLKENPQLINSTFLMPAPLELAAFSGSIDLLSFLLEHENINLKLLGTWFCSNKPNSNYYATVLHSAIHRNNLDFTQLLRRNEGLFNTPDSNGLYPIHLAIKKDREPHLLLLISDGGANLNLRTQDKGKNTAFELAIWERNAKALELLTQFGALKNLTAIHLARIKQLVEKRRDPSIEAVVNSCLSKADDAMLAGTAIVAESSTGQKVQYITLR